MPQENLQPDSVLEPTPRQRKLWPWILLSAVITAVVVSFLVYLQVSSSQVKFIAHQQDQIESCHSLLSTVEESVAECQEELEIVQDDLKNQPVVTKPPKDSSVRAKKYSISDISAYLQDELLITKPTQARIDGYVVHVEICPPCPEDAQCKTCQFDHIIISSDKDASIKNAGDITEKEIRVGFDPNKAKSLQENKEYEFTILYNNFGGGNIYYELGNYVLLTDSYRQDRCFQSGGEWSRFCTTGIPADCNDFCSCSLGKTQHVTNTATGEVFDEARRIKLNIGDECVACQNDTECDKKMRGSWCQDGVCYK